jgi:succinate dehydrogenase flavin-adding protein (antitoxin of CptAB toxin-antitoxin module)
LTDKKILTIWFDAWRYENEEFSALVPLVRTIILHLEEYVINSEENELKIAIKKLVKNFSKMGTSIIRNSKPNFGFEHFGAKASVETDMNKILQDYKSEGSFIRGQDEIRFYKHISEKIDDELKKIRKSDYIGKKGEIEENIELEEARKFKIVIFIDDLDRCTPERALEIIESIKTFFDIEGIIYVVGMDPATIDTIISTKYGEKSHIDGLHYLQKIVQLPFQIPIWSDNDLTDTIKEITKRTGLPKDITEKLLEPKIKDLIIKSAKLNPRNIKRFINSLVLSYDIYDENIKDINDQNLKNYIIENYLKSMISIQTFYFRGEKWLQFVRMILDYRYRVQFLTHFITFIESEKITSYQDLEDKIKDIPTLTYPKYNKKVLEIYNKIIEINDEDLFIFLTQAAEPLLRIDKIENYLRAVDTKKDIDDTKSIQEIKSYESINKLEHGIHDFNDYVQYSIIHLPYLPYLELGLSKGEKLQKIDFSRAFLFKANLLGTNLSGANLSNANLINANLSNSFIFNLQNYESLKLNKKTNFANAITNDTNFIYYISNFTEYIPEIANNKKELKLKLEQRQFAKEDIESVLSISNLPEE